jgi:hypothetical protein
MTSSLLCVLCLYLLDRRGTRRTQIAAPLWLFYSYLSKPTKIDLFISIQAKHESVKFLKTLISPHCGRN